MGQAFSPAKSGVRMIPSKRLLWLTAGLFPLAVAGGLSEPFRPVGLVIGLCCVAAALVDAFLSRGLLSGVRLVDPGSQRQHKDREFTFRLQFETGGLQRVRVGIPWPVGISAPVEEQETLVAAGTAVLDWKATPIRRGDFAIPTAAIAADSRFGLWEVRRDCSLGARFHVFPNLQSKDELLAVRRETGGEYSRRQIGRGREFEHLREYVSGDGLDEIDWKATARRGKPISRVFQVERTQEIYAAIDASRLTARRAGADIRLERYLQAALSLGAAAQNQGDRFGIVTYTDRVHDFVRAGKGSTHTALCRQAIYRLQPSAVPADFSDVMAHLRVHLRGRALIVFLTDLDEPSTSDSFLDAVKLLTRKHLVAAITIRPDGMEPMFTHEAADFDSVCGQIGGHLRWKAMRQTESKLRVQGVHFRMAEEATLSRQLAGLYGDIKKRQLL